MKRLNDRTVVKHYFFYTTLISITIYVFLFFFSYKTSSLNYSISPTVFLGKPSV